MRPRKRTCQSNESSLDWQGAQGTHRDHVDHLALDDVEVRVDQKLYDATARSVVRPRGNRLMDRYSLMTSVSIDSRSLSAAWGRIVGAGWAKSRKQKVRV